jgi:hypothetical protein
MWASGRSHRMEPKTLFVPGVAGARPPPPSPAPPLAEHHPGEEDKEGDVADETVDDAEVDEDVDDGEAAEEGYASLEVDPGVAAEDDVDDGEEGDVDGDPGPGFNTRYLRRLPTMIAANIYHQTVFMVFPFRFCVSLRLYTICRAVTIERRRGGEKDIYCYYWKKMIIFCADCTYFY